MIQQRVKPVIVGVIMVVVMIVMMIRQRALICQLKQSILINAPLIAQIH